jgi:hypothetical protein
MPEEQQSGSRQSAFARRVQRVMDASDRSKPRHKSAAVIAEAGTRVSSEGLGLSSQRQNSKARGSIGLGLSVCQATDRKKATMAAPLQVGAAGRL